MIKIIVISFLMLISFVGQTQTNLDSLWNVWEDESKEDTTRLKALRNYNISGFMLTNLDSSLFICELGLEKSRRGDYMKYTNLFIKLKGNIYNNRGNKFKKKGKYDLAIQSFLISLEVYKEIKDKGGAALAYLRMGGIYVNKGEFEQALVYYNKGLELAIITKNIKLESSFYNNLGRLYTEKGNYADAIDSYNQALKIDRKQANLRGQSIALINIGAVYSYLNNNKEAIEYFKKSLGIAIDMGYPQVVAADYANIGEMYNIEKDFIKAIEFYKKSLIIQRENGYIRGLTASLMSLSSSYLNQLTMEEIQVSSEYIREDIVNFVLDKERVILEVENMLKESLIINIEMNNNAYLSKNYLELGRLALYKNELNKAIEKGEKSYKYSVESDSPEVIKESTGFLYSVYEKTHNYKKALEMREEYIKVRDSLQNKENQKALIQYEYRSQYEKQAALDSIEHLKAQKIKEVQIAKQDAELENKKNQQYALFGGLVLVVLFALFMLRKNKQVQQQKKEIEVQKNFAEEQQQFAESQKEELSHQHNQIRDSIDYAQTLQKAVLPSFEDVTNNFTNNFVYFQPKDVVSGDFFWTFSKNEIKYLAVVDCTGHGVPGAFMTIVANNLLNEIVLDNFSTPKEIIEELHKRIKVRVGGHKDAKVRDSMDLGLLSYDAKNKKVNFVGTHTSLYLVRNSKLQKIKGSKADIGYSEEINVKEQIIDVLENDMLYLHSDGYPDQKGGEKGKKFYYQPIRNKFEEICLLNLQEQKSIMQKMFNDWKGEKEQLDDVCMVGVRI